MNPTQRFLIEASRTVGAGDYFRWHTVGAALGYSAAESERTMQVLSERKLVILLLDGDGRLLEAGRRLVVRLKSASNPASTRPAGSVRLGWPA